MVETLSRVYGIHASGKNFAHVDLAGQGYINGTPVNIEERFTSVYCLEHFAVFRNEQKLVILLDMVSGETVYRFQDNMTAYTPIDWPGLYQRHGVLAFLREDTVRNKTTIFIDPLSGQESDFPPILGAIFPELNLAITQEDSCVIALSLSNGEAVWRADVLELLQKHYADKSKQEIKSRCGYVGFPFGHFGHFGNEVWFNFASGIKLSIDASTVAIAKLIDETNSEIPGNIPQEFAKKIIPFCSYPLIDNSRQRLFELNPKPINRLFNLEKVNSLDIMLNLHVLNLLENIDFIFSELIYCFFI